MKFDKSQLKEMIKQLVRESLTEVFADMPDDLDRIEIGSNRSGNIQTNGIISKLKISNIQSRK